MLPGAGDELQGIKKGLLELVDVVAVNKADGDNLTRARAAASSLKAALHILASGAEAPPVLTYSALTGQGVAELWQAIEAHREKLTKKGGLDTKRREQQVRWMWSLIETRIQDRLRSDPKLKAKLPALESAVKEGKLPPALAADEIAKLLGL